MKRLIIIIVLLLSVIILVAQDNYQTVPYTLADRDRLIQVEANVNGLRNEMNSLRNEMNAKIEAVNQRFDGVQKQFDGINQRLDNLQIFLYWGFGLLFSFMVFMLGFILWDRRTTLAPVKREQDKIIEALKELSKNDPNIREALKKVALW